MCTVSIVPVASGYRLISNRDEQLTRPDALPPTRSNVDGRAVWCPVDTRSGGSWVGVNDAGLAVTLLNRHGLPMRRHGRGARCESRSRGGIVPALLGARDLAGVLERLDDVRPPVHAPFRVVAVQRAALLIADSDGQWLRVKVRRLERPAVFTSSSVGDLLAERLRTPLFERLVVAADDQLLGQQHFHDHRWPSCREFSVRMRRSDARTVSRSIVSVVGDDMSLLYQSLVPEK